MSYTYVPFHQFTVGESYTLKVGFSDEFEVYNKALYRGESNQELIFWVGGKSDGLVTLLRCNILESTLEIN